MSERKEQPYLHIARAGLSRIRGGQEWSEAWEAAAEALYGKGNNEHAQGKICPRKTFLTVLSLGWVTGVAGNPSSLPDKGNAAHAVSVVRYLLNNYAHMPTDQWPTSKRIWDAVREESNGSPSDCNIPVAHNGQVDVIRALWDDIDCDRVRAHLQDSSD